MFLGEYFPTFRRVNNTSKGQPILAQRYRVTSQRISVFSITVEPLQLAPLHVFMGIHMSRNVVHGVVGMQVKVKIKFTLEQATKAQRWRRGIALLFL